MIRDVLGRLDYSAFAEIALLGFLGVFVVVAVRTLRKPSSDFDHDARIPLDDTPERGAP